MSNGQTREWSSLVAALVLLLVAIAAAAVAEDCSRFVQVGNLVADAEANKNCKCCCGDIGKNHFFSSTTNLCSCASDRNFDYICAENYLPSKPSKEEVDECRICCKHYWAIPKIKGNSLCRCQDKSDGKRAKIGAIIMERFKRFKGPIEKF